MWKIALTGIHLLVTAMVPIVIYIATTVQGLDMRLTRIEANRFTSADGQRAAEDRNKIWRRLEKLPQEAPPAWFVARVDKLEHEVEALADKIDAALVRLKK